MNFEHEVDFKNPIGIELTFLPMNPKPIHHKNFNWFMAHEPGSWTSLTQALKTAAKARNVPGYRKIYTDPGCVEFPSPILKSWPEAKEWYGQALAAAEVVSLTPYEESQEGGCGHIHMGSLSKHEKSQVYVEAYKRPWLSWAFASPNVSKYCRSIAAMIIEAMNDRHSGGSYYTYTSHGGFERFGNRKFSNVDSYIHATLTVKYGLLSNRTKTLEWRAFDSASDWDEQASMIAFYHRFVAYSKAANDGKFSSLDKALTPHKVKQMFHKDIKACVKDFKKLISQLELSWADYEHLIKLNLEPAFEFGKRY